jgi:hypothetical protein
MAVTRSQSLKLERAIELFNYEKPTPQELAKCVFDFSLKELEMLDVFWGPAFNESWIILDRERIKEWFCKEDKSKDAVRNFYNRCLFKFEEGVDYQEITKEEYVDSSDLTNQTLSKKANHVKLYKVTGECFKMIGMSRNPEIRKYFIKVESMARCMVNYLSRCEVRQADEARQKAERRAINFQNFVAATEFYPKDEWLYIATSALYAKNCRFKVGSTTGSLKSRLQKYNTGRPEDDLYFMCWRKRVVNSNSADTKIKQYLAKFMDKKEGSKEMYIMGFDDLTNIVNQIAEHHNNDWETVNYYLKTITPGLADISGDHEVPPAINLDASGASPDDINIPTNDQIMERILELVTNLNEFKLNSNIELTRQICISPYTDKRKSWTVIKNFLGWTSSKSIVSLPGHPDIKFCVKFR